MSSTKCGQRTDAGGAARCSIRDRHRCQHLDRVTRALRMGSVIETAVTPRDGFNTGFMICGVIMLAGGLIGMALIRPECDATRRAGRA